MFISRSILAFHWRRPRGSTEHRSSLAVKIGWHFQRRSNIKLKRCWMMKQSDRIQLSNDLSLEKPGILVGIVWSVRLHRYFYFLRSLEYNRIFNTLIIHDDDWNNPSSLWAKALKRTSSAYCCTEWLFSSEKIKRRQTNQTKMTLRLGFKTLHSKISLNIACILLLFL